MKKSWQSTDKQTILRNAWFSVHQDKVIMPNGQAGSYTYMVNRPFVLVLARHARGWLMVEQFRYTLQQTMLEFPAGGIEPGEEPLQAARRELAEETGFAADSWIQLGTLHEAVSTNNAAGTVYLASHLRETPGNTLAEEGIEKLRFVSDAELADSIKHGVISDAKTIAAYYFAR